MYAWSLAEFLRSDLISAVKTLSIAGERYSGCFSRAMLGALELLKRSFTGLPRLSAIFFRFNREGLRAQRSMSPK